MLPSVQHETMMTRVGRRNWNCRCCWPYTVDRGTIRVRERRQWQRWEAEYEERDDSYGEYLHTLGIRSQEDARGRLFGLDHGGQDAL